MAHEIIGRTRRADCVGRVRRVRARRWVGAAVRGRCGDRQDGALAGRSASRARARFPGPVSRSSQSEVRTAFATLGDCLHRCWAEILPRLVPVQRRALEIAFLIREPEGPPPETRLLATALLSVVGAIAEDGPIVLALDDVQWVDASSADIIRFVLRRLEGEPVGVLAAVRGRPVAAPLELDRAFAALRRVPVTPLSVAAIHRLLWGRLSLNLSRPVLFVCTRRWAGTRSSRSSSPARSSTARFAPRASACRYPRT